MRYSIQIWKDVLMKESLFAKANRVACHSFLSKSNMTLTIVILLFRRSVICIAVLDAGGHARSFALDTQLKMIPGSQWDSGLFKHPSIFFVPRHQMLFSVFLSCLKVAYPRLTRFPEAALTANVVSDLALHHRTWWCHYNRNILFAPPLHAF